MEDFERVLLTMQITTSDPKALLMQYSVSNQYQDPSDWRTLLTECVLFLVYSAFVVASTLICEVKVNLID